MKRRGDSFRDYVLDQLREAGVVECRSMFGGYGLYKDGRFFGILYKGRFYLKTGRNDRAEYVKAGMKPFKPSARQTLKSYYEVPADVVESARELAAWAKRAFAASR